MTTRVCPICDNDYGDSTVPTLLICCMKHVCYSCAENDRSAKITNLTGNNKQIKCMFCNQKFHSSRETPWKVNHHFIEESGIDVDLTLVKKMQAAMEAMICNNQRKKGSRRRHDDATLNSSAADNSNNDISHNNAASTSSDAGTNLRRSQRLASETAAGPDEADDDDDDNGSVGGEADVEMQSSTINVAEEAAAKQHQHEQKYTIGTKISKEFKDPSNGQTRMYQGEIRAFYSQDKLYNVVFEDGDCEDMEENEIEMYLIMDEKGTQSSNDDIATNTSQVRQRKPRSSDSQEAGSKRKVVAAMPPAKRKQGSSRKSEKQKEKPRKKIAKDLCYLLESSLENVWDVNQSSFQSTELLPLDCVEFDKDKNRYQVTSSEGITEDDVILQAMVVFALYRMEKGWGKGRANKALSVWGGKPADDGEDDIFPLENLWMEEIHQHISEKVIGPTTLNHFDNFDNFPNFYLPESAFSTSKWQRRSKSYVGQVHIFAEQAAIQLALHLHEHVSRDYAILSSLIIFTALRDESEDTAKELASYLISLIDSSRKETDCFPKTALNDISAL